MTSNDKRQTIVNEIASNYDKLKLQCVIDLKFYHIFRNLNPDELLSDIIFNFLNKLDSSIYLEKIYTIQQKGKLIPYIGKSIDIQSRYTKAPFLQKRVKDFNKTEFIELYYNIEEETSDEPIIDDEKLVEEILNTLAEIEQKKLLGPYSFYYVELFNQYIKNEKITYKELAEKYKLSPTTVNRDMVYVKRCIIILLKEKGITFPKNRKMRFSEYKTY